jgi:hypothetical protein
MVRQEPPRRRRHGGRSLGIGMIVIQAVQQSVDRKEPQLGHAGGGLLHRPLHRDRHIAHPRSILCWKCEDVGRLVDPEKPPVERAQLLIVGKTHRQ